MNLGQVLLEEYDECNKKLEEDSDSYHEERLNEFESCMGKLKNLTIKNDAMYTLIAYALSPNNEKIRDSMLVALYDKCVKKEDFLKYFKKSEKNSQKSLESIDFKPFSIFPYEEGCERSVS